MKLLQLPENRTSVADVDVVGAIVTDEDNIVNNIKGMKLGEGAPSADAVHDQHRGGSFEVGLSCERDSSACKK